MPANAADVVLARGWLLEVETETPDTYVAIGGVDNFSPDNGVENADGGHFGTGGWAKHRPAERSVSITLSGKYLEDTADGARNAGQARVEALGMLTGQAAMGNFRFTSPGGNVVEFSASVRAPIPGLSSGGGRNDNSTWSVVLTVDGAPAVTAAV